MKIHQVSSFFTHFYPRKTEKFEVVEIKDENNHVIKTDVYRTDTYNKNGHLQDLDNKGAQVNELL